MNIRPQFEPLEHCPPALAEQLAQEIAGMNPWKRQGYSREALAAFLLNPEAGSRRYLLRSGEALAGLLCLRYPWLRGVQIEQLVIFPAYQGAGLEHQALEFVAAEYAPLTSNLWLL
ncbi:MAG: hypothetical protein HQL47_11430, partial [Gammaproteobacteria bacterium]|nr:hypothetical protein [Gammaproteobacteria bacterium]